MNIIYYCLTAINLTSDISLINTAKLKSLHYGYLLAIKRKDEWQDDMEVNVCTTTDNMNKVQRGKKPP